MKPRVLLVDDDWSIREALSKLLRAEQYEVILAADGKEAVDLFRDDPAHFDLVLADLNMPLRNGWASVDRLLELNSLLPIVILTGMSHQRELAEAAKVSALVEKPIDVPAFLNLLRELVADIEACEFEDVRRRGHRFHYIPPNHDRGSQMPLDPYSHWGLNE